MRLIDADALCEAFERTPWMDNADRDIAEELVDNAPTVSPWVKTSDRLRQATCEGGRGMTRQEAIRHIVDLAKHLDKIDEELEAEKLLAALGRLISEPEPDPDTGLVPCGCGGKAKIWPSEPTQFTHYEVGCTECAMTTGWVRGKQENAMKVWNTAMGGEVE